MTKWTWPEVGLETATIDPDKKSCRVDAGTASCFISFDTAGCCLQRCCSR